MFSPVQIKREGEMEKTLQSPSKQTPTKHLKSPLQFAYQLAKRNLYCKYSENKNFLSFLKFSLEKTKQISKENEQRKRSSRQMSKKFLVRSSKIQLKNLACWTTNGSKQSWNREWRRKDSILRTTLNRSQIKFGEWVCISSSKLNWKQNWINNWNRARNGNKHESERSYGLGHSIKSSTTTFQWTRFVFGWWIGGGGRRQRGRGSIHWRRATKEEMSTRSTALSWASPDSRTFFHQDVGSEWAPPRVQPPAPFFLSLFFLPLPRWVRDNRPTSSCHPLGSSSCVPSHHSR